MTGFPATDFCDMQCWDEPVVSTLMHQLSDSHPLDTGTRGYFTQLKPSKTNSLDQMPNRLSRGETELKQY
jgi:hypothetical protein